MGSGLHTSIIRWSVTEGLPNLRVMQFTKILIVPVRLQAATAPGMNVEMIIAINESGEYVRLSWGTAKQPNEHDPSQ